MFRVFIRPSRVAKTIISGLRRQASILHTIELLVMALTCSKLSPYFRKKYYIGCTDNIPNNNWML